MNPDFVVPVSAQELEDRTAQWSGEIDKAASLVRDQGVTALMAASEWTACVLCRGLQERGIRVPTDVSITGFDGMDPLGVDGMQFTSTRIPGEAMGAEALRRVLLRLAEPSRPTQAIHFACTLIEGKSTAPPHESAMPGPDLKPVHESESKDTIRAAKKLSGSRPKK
jgi:DNA-binding LacI/PurR family transcriptional regulator